MRPEDLKDRVRWADDRIWQTHSTWPGMVGLRFFEEDLRKLGSPASTIIYIQHINGIGAENLADKERFLWLINNLGYDVPNTVVVPRNPDRDIISLVTKAFESDLEKGAIIAKPVDGSKGRGVKLLSRQEDLEQFLANLQRRYIFQPYLPMDEFRYGWYEDNDKIRWRFCFQKLKAEVTGDGSSTLAHLIVNQPRIPVWARIINLYNQRANLRDVPGRGENRRLSTAANWQRGGYMKPIARESDLVYNLDSSVLALTSELEEAINNNVGGILDPYSDKSGVRLRFVCYDVGLLDGPNWRLNRFEVPRKQGLYPIEFQMPCSINYFFLSGDQNPLNRLRALMTFQSMVWRENTPK